MKKNDIVNLLIEDIGVDGEGIGKVDGLTLFVKDAVVGDRIIAKIMKLKKHYGYAKLMEIVEPSPDRVTAQCPHSKRCGGCQIMEISYEKQLEFKQNKVRNNLKRIGQFSEYILDKVMEPIVGSGDSPNATLRYRNKAQFPVGYDKDGKLIAGFYAGRTHSIIECDDCLLGSEINKVIIDTVLSFMREYNISAYDEAEHKGLVRHILIRVAKDTKQVMVCLIINGKNIPNEKILIDRLIKIDGVSSISTNSNTERTNVILGKTTVTLWGKDYIEDSIYLRDTKDFGRTETKTMFRISPQSFYQVNPEQTEKLYSLALEFADLTGNETVWDLYCGIGTISLFLASKAKAVFGVEIVPQAIINAKENAKLNNLDNAFFYTGAAEEVIPDWLNLGQGSPEVVVVDPPRKGLDVICIDTIIKASPDRIVYVSCDSATLARDLKLFSEGGYELKRVRPVDQFAHTCHVESVSLLIRKR